MRSLFRPSAAPLLRSPAIRDALRSLRSEKERTRTLDEQIALSRIPAPPFGEGPRALRFASLLEEAGLPSPSTDAEGNVIAEWRDVADPAAPPVVLAAHLDTVFPAGTVLEPRRDGNRIRLPGILDNGRGLAAILALARIVTGHPLPLRSPLLFVGTVGEEGPGDLRGVRHLFRPGSAAAGARAFLALDGAGRDAIVTRAVAVRRYRIELRGEGGHSWNDFGRPNPIHRLTVLLERVLRIRLPDLPKTTLSITGLGGGTAPNALPEGAWAELELRSESGEILRGIDRELLGLLETHSGPESSPECMITLRGDRPAGALPPDAPLFRAAEEATRIVGGRPVAVAASTDANIPLSLGVPALALGAGGIGGGAHTPDEWYADEEGPEGIARILYTLLLHDRESPRG